MFSGAQRKSVVNVSKRPLLFKGEFSLCRVNNGGCQDLCLLTSEGRVNCSCRGDRKLLEDSTCSGYTINFFLTKIKAGSLPTWMCQTAAFLNAFFFLSCSALNTTCNIVDEFECGNGDCINYTLTCDGMANCKDKSDEKQSYCGKGFVFFFWVFFSLKGLQIHSHPQHQLFDRTLFPVPANRVCKKGYRRCVNGRCVGHGSWCNGLDDCGDNSDEIFCNSKSNF